LGNEAEKRRRVLEAVIAISMDSMGPGKGEEADEIEGQELEHMAITMFGCPAPDEIDDE